MRITGGRFRSRLLRAPRGNATRPTSDRVREALFSVLSSRGVFDDRDAPLAVLDLYAGSGSLAFEAISRGAETAVLVEQGRDAIAAIRENANALGVDEHVRVLARSVERALSELDDATFDVIFIDPPYADVVRPAFSEVLAAAAQRLRPEAVLVLEHSSADVPSAPTLLSLEQRKTYGDTALSFFSVASS